MLSCLFFLGQWLSLGDRLLVILLWLRQLDLGLRKWVSLWRLDRVVPIHGAAKCSSSLEVTYLNQRSTGHAVTAKYRHQFNLRIMSLAVAGPGSEDSGKGDIG